MNEPITKELLLSKGFTQGETEDVFYMGLGKLIFKPSPDSYFDGKTMYFGGGCKMYNPPIGDHNPPFKLHFT